MPIYKGSTKIYSPTKGTSPVKQIFLGDEPIYAQATVNFDETGGNSVANKNVYYLDTYGTLPSTSKSYYSFKGWYTSSSGGSLINSASTVYNFNDHTLYAQWNYNPSAPTVSYVSNSQTSLTFNVENNNPYSVTLYFEAADSTPDINPTTIAAHSDVNVTVTGLASGTLHTVYFRFYVGGYYSSTVSQQYSTQSAAASNWVHLYTSGDGLQYDYDSAVSRTNYTSCPTTTSVDSWLTSSYPPSNYSVGHVIRAHITTKTNLPCGYYWFEAQ